MQVDSACAVCLICKRFRVNNDSQILSLSFDVKNEKFTSNQQFKVNYVFWPHFKTPTFIFVKVLTELNIQSLNFCHSYIKSYA